MDSPWRGGEDLTFTFASDLRSHLLFPLVDTPKSLHSQDPPAPRSRLGLGPWLRAASALTAQDPPSSLGHLACLYSLLALVGLLDAPFLHVSFA